MQIIKILLYVFNKYLLFQPKLLTHKESRSDSFAMLYVGNVKKKIHVHCLLFIWSWKLGYFGCDGKIRKKKSKQYILNIFTQFSSEISNSSYY